MPTYRGSRTRRTRAPRQKTTWENLAFDLPFTSAASQTVANLTPEPMQTVHGGVGLATVKRIILNGILAVNNNTTHATNLQHIFIGICVVTLDAFTAGAVPDPSSDFNQDWLYWTSRSIMRPATQNSAYVTWEADIRSARKLRGGYVLALVVDNGDGNDVSFDVGLSMRLLWSQSP